MTAYEWPPLRGRKSGRAAERSAWNLSRSREATPQALEDALELTRMHEADRGVRRDSRGRRIAAHGPPTSNEALWQPIGPFVGLRGQADSDPRVAGRVRDLAISTDGMRAYAASANGGVWYSEDAGARWEPVGAFAMTRDRTTVKPSSHTLVCGCLLVVFDVGGDVAADEVWVGTGEPRAVFDLGIPGGSLGGVGVLHKVGPVKAVRDDREADPWEREALGLAGQGIYRIAAAPGQPGRLVAATTRGLWVRDPAAGAGVDPWSQLTVAVWVDGTGAAADDRVVVTDVVWPRRDRVTYATRSAVANLTGVWQADGDPSHVGAGAGLDKLTAVNLAVAPTHAVVDAAGAPTVLRIGLAAAPALPDIVYAVASGPLLWRIDTATAHVVRRAPPELFMLQGGNDQSDYDMAIAVSPEAGGNRVVLGGSTAQSPVDGSWSAALYRLAVGAVAGDGHYPTDQTAAAASAPTWIGAEVHADVHVVRWFQVGGVRHLWVGCDGGVFRSVSDGDLGTFVARTSGLEAGEVGAIANHPLSDGPILAGLQDNGVQLRIGGSLWREVHAGDGGGVAFDPSRPSRWVAQYVQATWQSADQEVNPTQRGPDPATDGPHLTESGASSFYSLPAVRRRTDGTVQLAVGTTRVWYSESWGHSFWDGGVGVWRRNWATLPSAVGVSTAMHDPRAGNANDAATDNVPNGPIVVLRWVNDDRLLVLASGWVGTLQRAAGKWTRALDVSRPAPPPPPAPVPPLPAAATPPDLGSWNDVAVHDPARGPHGSFYLATSHPLEPVWWFDGTGQFFPTNLGALPPPPPAAPPPDGVRAPAYAVVVDPAHREVVFAGTAVGVWRATLTFDGAGTPSWNWGSFNNGIPEAAVQDLVIGTWPVQGGPDLRLLRAGLQARGVWELDLDRPRPPQTYVRLHPHDTRWASPSSTVDPLMELDHADRDWGLDPVYVSARDFRDAAGHRAAHPDGTPATDHLWHASPDLRVRPAQGAPAPTGPPAGTGWTSAPSDRHALWVLQTALHALDPTVTKDAPSIVPDGRWTGWFVRRLPAIRTSLGLPAARRVDQALWTNAAVVAARYADPWADGGPSEADLVERVRGPSAPRRSPASAGVYRGPAKVDVLVHHRGQDPLPGTDVAVVLLRVLLPVDPTTWAALVVPPLTGAVSTAVAAALDGLPDAGGALPAPFPLVPGSAAADVGVAVRRLPRPVAPGRPVVVTFDADFSAAAAGERHLLLAFVHSRPDPLDLPGGALRDMLVASHHLAARSVQVLP